MNAINYKAICAAVKESRGAAHREARQYWPFVSGRDGALLCTSSKTSQCEPNIAAECPRWDGRRASIERLVADVLANYPQVDEVYIEGAYDGADQLGDTRDYEPRVTEWCVPVWRRDVGYVNGDGSVAGAN